MRNSTLNSLDKESIRVLPSNKQRIFTKLHGLSGEAYQNKLKEAMPDQLKKVNWVMKTKLTND